MMWEYDVSKVRATVLLTHCRVIGHNYTPATSAVAEWFDCAWWQNFVNELAPPTLQTFWHERTTR